VSVAAGTPTLRVLSYNAESGEGSGGYPAVLAEVERHSPDIVFLEEIGAADRVAGLLRERFPFVYHHDQFVVGSRFAITETYGPERPPNADRAHIPEYVRVAFDTPLGRVIGYAVHPISPRDSLNRVRAASKSGLFSGRVFGAANAAAFYGNSEARERQTKAFAEAAWREIDPVFIAGDTNLPDLSVVFARYLSAFADGFREAGSGFGYTFPADKRVPPWMRIDRILASRELRFVRFEVGTARASDHLCVVADLARR
jgi:endonuclease/exonuclease/phosphatase family metal-dependent hydrolase